MAIPKKALDLIERFENNRAEYMSGKYNETQLRREFIDPFFEALGWDVGNRGGYPEAYKDVIHEDTIKIGGATKAPDYCFRTGGTRRFFLEAKKPSVNLKDGINPAFQLRRYAWSAKLPLSILTDFEEFAIYDCRIKPDKNDKASTARILYIKSSEYVERWDEIASIFSREAVLQGSFDQYAETTRAKRGTSEVDAAFLKEIESWRESLARNLALRNPELSQRDLNFAVQRTIDRIIFLRICEDRGIEPYGRLMKLLKGDGVYSRLAALFQKADERYNSGLFHFQNEKGRLEEPDELTLNLAFDDKPLKEIIKSLYYPDSPYEFSVLPADILGQVYEQFLGKVILLTAGHRAVVKDKPEVKKARGVYYTPTYIVDYIVRNTVGKLCEGKKPSQVARLRVLDPACGSGSFLIGAYQYLLDWHLNWYVEDGSGKHKKELYRGPTGEWRLATAERKRILLNNIYGVDIDFQAVEVTKLSLLLKVLEGESEQTLASQLRLFQERALPDLGSNIKWGNSLIGSDFYDNAQMSLIGEDDRYRINVFDWSAEFPGIMKSGGFDAIVGNPPYGAEFKDQTKTYLNRVYQYQSYQLDSYLLFLERAVKDLTKPNGLFGMIIPNPWLTNVLQTKMRRFVVEQTCVREIVHFKFPVFQRVTVDTEIVILEKKKADNFQSVVSIVDSLNSASENVKGFQANKIIHEQRDWIQLAGGVINIFLSSREKALIARVWANAQRLDSYFEINVGVKPYQTGKGTPPQTAKVVETRPFDSEQKETEFHRQYLRGADINRYQVSPVKIRFLKYGAWLAEPRPAANFDAPEKIFMRQTGDSLVAALDSEQLICLNNMHVLVPCSPEMNTKYFLGVINSKLLNWIHQTNNPEVGEALAEVKRVHIAQLPIHTINFSDPVDKARHDRIVELVEGMLALHKQLAAAKAGHSKTAIQRQIDATDRQINKLVYDLYGLTKDEIEIVEGAT